MDNKVNYCEKGERRCRHAKSRKGNCTVCMYYVDRGMELNGIGTFFLKECPRVVNKRN